jgi:hypothetical protein
MFGIRRTLMLVGIGGFAYGVYNFYDRQFKILQNLCFNVGNVQIIQSSYSEVKLLITLNVVNKSEISFKITGYTLNVSINEQAVGLVRNQTLNEQVRGLGENSKIDFYAIFSPQQLLGTDLLGSVLGDIANTNIKVVGRISLSKWGIPISDYPISETINLQEMILYEPTQTDCP